MTRAIIFVLSLLVLGFAFEQRLLWMLVPYPTSTDGFYYLKEIAHRVAHGHGYYTSFSPYFFFAAGAGKLLGMHEGMLYPLLVLFGLLLLSLGFMLPTLRRDFLFISPLAALTPWVSDIIFFRAYAFPRQTLSLALVSIAVGLALRTERALRWSSYLLFVASAAVHALGALLGAACVVVNTGALRLQRALVALLFVACGALLAFAIVAGNKELLRPEFTTLLPSWVGECQSLGCSTFEVTEFAISTVLALVLLCWFVVQPYSTKKLVALVLVGAYIVFNLPVWDSEGFLSSRLAFASLVPLLLALFIAQPPLGALLSLMLFGLSLVLPTHSYSDKDLPFKALLRNRSLLQSWIATDDLVRADHGHQFIVSYALDRKALKRYPSGTQFFELSRRNTRRPECVNSLAVTDVTSLRCIDLGNRWIMSRRNSK